MSSDNTHSDGAVRMGRRKLLALGAAATAGIAGCSSNQGSDSAGESTGTGSGTTASTENTKTKMSGGKSPKEFTRSFYKTLYDEADLEGANGMYHEKSPAPALTAEAFSRFGGLESMQADVKSVEIVSKGKGTARVHADVSYTTAIGSATNTDYLYLRKAGDQWKMNVWLAETPRKRLAKKTVKTFYKTLYTDNDIEGANELYHPDSSAPAIKASDFKQFGGIEAMQAEIKSTEIISEGNGTAEVHADVKYTTPAGSSTATDHVFLKLQRGSWKINRWLPEAVRESGTETESGS